MTLTSLSVTVSMKTSFSLKARKCQFLLFRLIRLFVRIFCVTQENQPVIMMATGNSETDIIKECVKDRV